MPASRPTQTARAFTLIELLVVITIIGILASAMMVAINQIRVSGKRTTCMARERQLGMSVLAYSQDTGYLMTTTAADGRPWLHVAMDYLGEARPELTSPVDQLRRTVAWCGEFRGVLAAGNLTDATIGGYALNALPLAPQNLDPVHNARVRMSAVSLVGQRVLIGEWTNAVFTAALPAGDDAYAVVNDGAGSGDRHGMTGRNNRINAIFFDLRAATIQRDVLANAIMSPELVQ
jgi:prepilin-type N-terminal cleavage/methylation domain-containing protein